MTREEILEEAKKCVCGHREQDYGKAEDNFGLIADFWNDYLKLRDLWFELGEMEGELKEREITLDCDIPKVKPIDSTDVAMMMALLKIARIKNGGGSGDSFVDLAGYAACGGELNA